MHMSARVILMALAGSMALGVCCRGEAIGPADGGGRIERVGGRSVVVADGQVMTSSACERYNRDGRMHRRNQRWARLGTRAFANTDALDYVRCSSVGASPPGMNRLTPRSHLDYQHSVYNVWTRQIVMMKDRDPLGPNYFVVHDSLRSPIPATWRMWFEASEVQTHSHGATGIGKDDVDTDVFFVTPTDLAISSEPMPRSTHGFNSEGKYGRTEWTQLGLVAAHDSAVNYHAVIYPRLKGEPPPRFMAMEGGKVVRIETPAGVDYVMLAPRPFQFQNNDVTFDGKVGAVQQRGARVTLSLGAAGRVAVQSRELQAEAAVSHSW